jgi:hypothetical protein
MIDVNSVLRDMDSGTESRVLWVSAQDDTVYLFDLSTNALPYAVSLRQLEQRLSDGTAEQAEDLYLCMTPEDALPEKAKALRDDVWAFMHEIIVQEPAIYNRNQRGAILKQAAEQTGKGQNVLYKWLKRYWQRGKTKNAFLPDFHNRGGAKGQGRSPSDKCIGRRPLNSDQGTKNIDAAICEIFEQAVKRFYHTRKEHTFKAAYELMVKEFFTKPVQQPDGSTRLELLPAGEIPTLRQFRYWYSKHYGDKERIVSRKGQSRYDLNYRPILGKSDSNITGPGAQYQIDATVGDIYLVSQFNRANIIDRPVIYFIIDTFSRMVAGMYVGLEGPSWTGAMMALANAATDKVSFCQSYGVEISESQWPCRHIPDSILADRGEMESKSVETLINALNIRVDNAPAYRADMKGIVEQFFRTINTKTTVFLPGHVKPDMMQRGGKDYRLDAKLDIRQFTKIMIQCALNHNNEHYLEGYERSEAMIADDVEPIPVKLWEWGIAHCSGLLRSVPEDAIKLCLLPADTALVTAKGIRFKGLYYLSERAVAEQWFERARARGSYRVDISYDPRDMGHIYVRNIDSALCEPCFLADWEAKWNGKSFDEVAYQQSNERAMRQSHANRELQASVDLGAEIDKIVAEAEQMSKQAVIPVSKKARTAGIRDNRAGEKQLLRQEEAFRLAEEAMPAELPLAEPEEEFISPTMALIKQKLEARLNAG